MPGFYAGAMVAEALSNAREDDPGYYAVPICPPDEMCEHPDALSASSWHLLDPIPTLQLSGAEGSKSGSGSGSGSGSSSSSSSGKERDDHGGKHDDNAKQVAAKNAMYVAYVNVVFNVLDKHLEALPAPMLAWVGRAAAELDGTFDPRAVAGTVGLLVAELATRARFDIGLERLLHYRDETIKEARTPPSY